MRLGILIIIGITFTGCTAKSLPRLEQFRPNEYEPYGKPGAAMMLGDASYEAW